MPRTNIKKTKINKSRKTQEQSIYIELEIKDIEVNNLQSVVETNPKGKKK